MGVGCEYVISNQVRDIWSSGENERGVIRFMG